MKQHCWIFKGLLHVETKGNKTKHERHLVPRRQVQRCQRSSSSFFFSLTFELVGKHLQEEPPLLLSFTLLRIKYQTLTSAATATLLDAAEVLPLAGISTLMAI